MNDTAGPWQWPEAHWRALVDHVRAGKKDVDGRDKPGHDGIYGAAESDMAPFRIAVTRRLYCA